MSGPPGDRCAQCLRPAGNQIHVPGSQARFEAMFDHRPRIDVRSPDPLPYRTQVRRGLLQG